MYLPAALSNLLNTAVSPGFKYKISVEGDETLIPLHIHEQLFLILREDVRSEGRPGEGCRLRRGQRAGLLGTEDNGIRSMREWAKLMGGTFDLSSVPDAGTTSVTSILTKAPERGAEQPPDGLPAER